MDIILWMQLVAHRLPSNHRIEFSDVLLFHYSIHDVIREVPSIQNKHPVCLGTRIDPEPESDLPSVAVRCESSSFLKPNSRSCMLTI